MSNSNKLLILDGNSVLHRAYYALPDWRNRSGEATAGVYGFLSILLKSIEDLRPTHLAIVFDHPSPTFRNLMYVGYQANREKDRQISEDIWSMIEKLKQVFQLLSIPVFQIEGFEADDVIGTICQKLKNSLPADATHQALQAGKTQKSKAIVITGDRDLMQLVNENVNLYMSFKGISDMTVVDSEKVKERLGILPSQVIDYKALVGDGSDNYPGVPGIGPVGAIKLIQEFGSFEKIYESLSITPQPPLNLRGGLIEKLVNGYESAELSKRLATIKCDVPFTFTIASCLVPSASKITEVLLELGYKSLIRRVAVKSSDEDSSRPRLF